MTKSCYFCLAAASSKEHVPPQCIFPEMKDSPDGKNYRLNLMTVPSCDAHNGAKSQDDVYLMMVLVSYFQNNEAAQNQIKSKVTRAWMNDPTLATSVVKNLQQVSALGRVHHAFEIDTLRFNRTLELIAHGLHFHTIKARPVHPYRAISYPVVQLEGPHANEVNQGRVQILAMADAVFVDRPVRGENKDIFWFQISPEINSQTSVVRMCFFEAFTVVALSSPGTAA